MKLLNLITCFIFGHKWTSNAAQGIKPNNPKLNFKESFKEYAKMYCDRCGTESKLNNRL
jgi:hypothetical protein